MCSEGARSLHKLLVRSAPFWLSVKHINSRSEARIRTLSLSIVAVAAVAASLMLTRSRGEHDSSRVTPGEQQSARLQLDAIRAAGL